jgi:hypothetical protein
VLIEVGLGTLLVLAWRKADKRGQMSEERERVYLAALEDLTDTTKLRSLADDFDKHGYHIQAKMLRARADLRDSTPIQKKARREAYDKAMQSENIEGILKVAKAFEQATATGAAAKLRQRAAELQIKKAEEAVKKKEEDKEKKNGVPEVVAEVVSDAKQESISK